MLGGGGKSLRLVYQHPSAFVRGFREDSTRLRKAGPLVHDLRWPLNRHHQVEATGEGRKQRIRNKRCQVPNCDGVKDGVHGKAWDECG